MMRERCFAIELSGEAFSIFFVIRNELSVRSTVVEDLPPIIQGGMGVGVSGWRLAKAVAECGQLGVVSGTALDLLLTRNLQLGDPSGDLRRALSHFPYPAMVEPILEKYFIPGGKDEDAAFRTPAMVTHLPSRTTRDLVVVSSFVALYLAKEGHEGVVGLNLLEKIQTPTLLALYGAMLAGVDVVLMGAGIPRQIPKILDDLAAGLPAEMRLDVKQASDPVSIHLDPTEFGPVPVLKRPWFLAIVSSHVLAQNLHRKASGKVDGFIVEASVAGGHNAPPRGAMEVTAEGEPIYGERDVADLPKFVEIGLPFWLAGGYGKVGKLKEAQAMGAHGIQVGSVFALSEESGFEPALKSRLIEAVRTSQLKIKTDAFASPTGFPFKVAAVQGSIADSDVYQERARVCDLGVLRETYEKENGEVGFRCAAEPIEQYVAKGGLAEEAVGRMCLCNSLCAAAGIAQVRHGEIEPVLVTLGDDMDAIRDLLSKDGSSYHASDVIQRLLD